MGRATNNSTMATKKKPKATVETKKKPKQEEETETPMAVKKATLETKKKPNQEQENAIFSANSFSSLGLDDSLCKQLNEKMGFVAPTQVQAQAIPVILSGRHVLVNAATGTGKTVTYLAPIIQLLLKIRLTRADGTFALVLVPTHELCMQVYEIAQKILFRYSWIIPGYIMGGENRSKEKARLRKGITILIATPGRLLDHLKNTSSFTHTNLRWIIFDEADRILELGYGKEIEEILRILSSKKDDSVSSSTGFQRQNLLLSATLNEKVNHLANMSLENPVLVGLGNKSVQLNPLNEHHENAGSDVGDESDDTGDVMNSSVEDYKLPSQLVQRFVKVPCGSRLAVLLSVLKHLFENEASQKVVVFFSTCDAVDFHFSLLSQFLWSTKSQPEAEHKQKFLRCKTFRLHGNMKHEDRRTTFQAFKTESMSLLLSTDVSARGLDFPKVRCIIQYDSPGEATEYVHRVGRTARMGERGESLLFLQPVEIDYLHDLQKHGVSLSEYPLLKVLDTFPIHSQQPHTKKATFVDMHPWILILQKSLESFVSTDPTIKALAKDAFCSWIRAYTAHRGELKRIFVAKKLHLGHVAKSFALKDQPSLVGKSFQTETKKRKRDERQKGQAKRKRVNRKP